MKKNLVIIFDFDGTIADTINSIKEIMDQLSDEFGFKRVTDDEFKKLKGKETREVFKKIGVPLTRISPILKKVRAFLTLKIKETKPIKGIKKVLPRLKRKGYKLGILTSSPKENVKIFLKNNDLDLFDFIYSESNIFNKAKKMNTLLKEKKLNSKNVFYVGDEARDIKAAKEAKVKTIAVTWGFNNEKILKKQKPDYLIKKPKELVKLLCEF